MSVGQASRLRSVGGTAHGGRASVPPHMPRLVARHKELSELMAVVMDPPAVAVVEGEAGVGKTRLVEALLGQPELRSTAVLMGACHPAEDPYPLGAIVEALAAAGDELRSWTAWSSPRARPESCRWRSSRRACSRACTWGAASLAGARRRHSPASMSPAARASGCGPGRRSRGPPARWSPPVTPQPQTGWYASSGRALRARTRRRHARPWPTQRG